MLTLNLNLQERSYPIYIGEDILTDITYYKGIQSNTKVMIVSNETVATLYIDKVKEALIKIDSKVYVSIVPDGEQYKNLDTFNQVITAMLENDFDRNSYVIALGGGVIGDLAGFVAASYQRGVNLIQIPTTLLAQVDSSVGGKTGLNHKLAKNMIGSFYQPKAVIIDTNTLKTLNVRELNSGFGEIIKYGLLGDLDFFNWLEANALDLLELKSEKIASCIYHCCKMKSQIVENDEKEKANRKLLNLGHTFGHAIEAFTNYDRYLHGEAIAVGTMIAAVLSYHIGNITKENLIKIETMFNTFNLPTQVPDIMATKDFFAYMQKDKKVEHGKLNLVLLKELGVAYVTDQIAKNKIEQAIEKCSAPKYHLANN